MAKSTGFVRATDVGFWAVVALSVWGFVLVSGTVQPLIPGWILSSLHASRLDGASFNQLRGDFADLEAQTSQLRADTALLRQRLAMSEDARSDVTKRVGALELSVPKLIEAASARPPAQELDTAAITASTGTGAGGPIRVTTIPLTATVVSGEPSTQPMPVPLNTATPDPGAFGIALGPPILSSEGPDAWRQMTGRIGTLLVGLGPILGSLEGSPGRRLIAGPLPSEAAARELCGGMAKAGIACASVPFVGDPL